MYCKFCGKQTSNPMAICDDCRREFEATATPTPQKSEDYIPQAPTHQPTPTYAPTYTPPQPVTEQPARGRMYGFGFALASVLLFFPGFFIGVGLTEEVPVLGVPMMFACIIISFIFGIKSIVNFNRCAKANQPRPIATLVLGIHGLVFSSIFILIITVAFFVGISLGLGL